MSDVDRMKVEILNEAGEPYPLDDLVTMCDVVAELEKSATAMAAKLKNIKSHTHGIKMELHARHVGEGVAAMLSEGVKSNLKLFHKSRYSVKDYGAFWEFVVENEAYDLVQKRLSDEAVSSRIANGVDMPFIKVFDSPQVQSVKKAAGSKPVILS